MGTADVTLKAAWSQKTHKITFDANGGKVSESSRTVAEGAAYGDLPTPTRDGYTFAGWQSGNTTVSASTKMGTADVTLKANWTQNKHTLTLDYNDGSGKKETRTLTAGTEYGTLPNPTRLGYTFNGWQTSGGGNVSASTKMGTADVTIIAVWTQNPTHKITYWELNGATHSNPTSFVEGTGLITLSNPSSIPGYTFKGWKVPSGPYVTTIDPSKETHDIILDAIWEAETYSITYQGVDGATNNNPTTIIKGSGPIALNEPSKSSYAFAGWYIGENKVTSISGTGNIVLTAKWKKKYIVTFSLDIFDGDTFTYIVTEGDGHTAPSDKLYHEVSSGTFDADVTFKQWTNGSITINGGDPIDNLNVEAGSTVVFTIKEFSTGWTRL